MTREQAQKRSMVESHQLQDAGRSNNNSSYPAAGSTMSAVPPKKRPRPRLEPESHHEREASTAPLDLSARSTPSSGPPQVPASSPAGLLLNCPTAWQAAAIYAQYVAYFASFQQPAPPPPPPPSFLTLPLPPPPPPQLRETDFLCSCGRSYSSLFGLTLHLKSAGSGHYSSSSASSASSAVTAVTADHRQQPLPKLVRGQDMWINSDTEQTREILRCIRCGQSYASLPELTMHMMRTGHYAEVMYPPPPATAVKQRPLASPRPARAGVPPTAPAPAYLSPHQPTPPLIGRPALPDNNPLSCLQRLVNEATAPQKLADISFTLAAAASPSAASLASNSSTSDAASVNVAARTPASSSATSTPPPPMLRCSSQKKQKLQSHQQKKQQLHQQQLASCPKKVKCHHCGKLFANKGQVRLHISKTKCPASAAAAAAAAASARFLAFAVPEAWDLPR